MGSHKLLLLRCRMAQPKVCIFRMHAMSHSRRQQTDQTLNVNSLRMVALTRVTVRVEVKAAEISLKRKQSTFKADLAAVRRQATQWHRLYGHVTTDPLSMDTITWQPHACIAQYVRGQSRDRLLCHRSFFPYAIIATSAIWIITQLGGKEICPRHLLVLLLFHQRA